MIFIRNILFEKLLCLVSVSGGTLAPCALPRVGVVFLVRGRDVIVQKPFSRMILLLAASLDAGTRIARGLGNYGFLAPSRDQRRA